MYHPEKGPVGAFYETGKQAEYDAHVSNGKRPDGNTILAQQWSDTPADIKGIRAVGRDLFQRISETAPLFQSAAIIDDEDEGHCITVYGSHEKKSYDLDVKEGKLSDGRPVIKHKWLRKPVIRRAIDTIARKLFDESYR